MKVIFASENPFHLKYKNSLAITRYFPSYLTNIWIYINIAVLL